MKEEVKIAGLLLAKPGNISYFDGIVQNLGTMTPKEILWIFSGKIILCYNL